jgi:hypothetical protein
MVKFETPPQYVLPGIRTFQLVQYVDGWPKSFPESGEGTMDDLPANLQDIILNAMERTSLKHGIALAVVSVRMGVDVDRKEDDPRGYIYLWVILSEVVAINVPGTLH